MADIVPAWMWRDPYQILEALLRLSGRGARVRRPLLVADEGSMAVRLPGTVERDRYYTMARRVHVKQVMRGRR